MSQPSTCTRCGIPANHLIKHEHKNDDGEQITDWLCWDCDFDIINGRGEYEDDDVWARHQEQNYDADPVYYPKPTWLP